MWNCEEWVFIDFEVFGIEAVPESIHPGILGLVVETPEQAKYCCIVIDEGLEQITKIFPNYTLFNPEMKWDLVYQKIREYDPLGNCKYMFSWSENDAIWLKRFFSDFSNPSLLEPRGLRTMNALPDTRRLGRKLWGMRVPHSLSRYMDKANYSYPSNVTPTEIMSNLKDIWGSSPNRIDGTVEKMAYELLRYNYHDCFGMRTVMRILNEHEDIPTGDPFFDCSE